LWLLVLLRDHPTKGDVYENTTLARTVLHPEVDSDQTADESFASLGGGAWDMTPHLAAPSAPVLLWPGNQPLPASLECVGVLGGTEENEDNNEFRIAGSRQFWITWHRGCSDGYVWGMVNDVHIHLQASIIGAGTEREIVNWGAPELSAYSNGWNECWGYDRPESDTTFFSDRFFLMGDEQFKVRISNSGNAGAEHYNVGSVEIIVDPEYEYSFFNDPNSPTRDASWDDPGYYAIDYSFHASDRRPDSGRLSTLFKVCRVSSGDD
jgi:hypothetical protein